MAKWKIRVTKGGDIKYFLLSQDTITTGEMKYKITEVFTKIPCRKLDFKVT